MRSQGMPLALCPAEHWQPSLHGQENENPFCALAFENELDEGRNERWVFKETLARLNGRFARTIHQTFQVEAHQGGR